MIKQRKKLGQNFLKNKHIAIMAVNSSLVEKNDIILEIGPGKGFLTRQILESGEKLIAIETDIHLIEHLQSIFINEIESGKLVLIKDDITSLDISTLGLTNGGYKVIANIPYYITGQIIRKFLSSTLKPKTMVLMLQKEVARRIIASDKKESILSISVKAFCLPKYIHTVKAGNFSPKPKVDSALIGFFDIASKIKDVDEEHFFEVLKVGFAQKRKLLVGNLHRHYGLDLLDKFDEINIPRNVRAEDISFEQWLKIACFIPKTKI